MFELEVSLWYKAKSVVKKASWVRPIIYQATSTYVHVCSQWFNDSKKTLLLRIDVIVASCSCDWPAIKIPVSPHSAALEAWHSKVSSMLICSQVETGLCDNELWNIRLFFAVCKFMKKYIVFVASPIVFDSGLSYSPGGT